MTTLKNPNLYKEFIFLIFGQKIDFWCSIPHLCFSEAVLMCTKIYVWTRIEKNVTNFHRKIVIHRVKTDSIKLARHVIFMKFYCILPSKMILYQRRSLQCFWGFKDYRKCGVPFTCQGSQYIQTSL